jgi:hypothetical protein
MNIHVQGMPAINNTYAQAKTSKRKATKGAASLLILCLGLRHGAHACHMQALNVLVRIFINWSRGVTASTLDSESSDRGSNPRGTSIDYSRLSRKPACFMQKFFDFSQI